MYSTLSSLFPSSPLYSTGGSDLSGKVLDAGKMGIEHEQGD